MNFMLTNSFNDIKPLKCRRRFHLEIHLKLIDFATEQMMKPNEFDKIFE